MVMNWMNGNWGGGMLTSSLERVNMLNDDKIQKPNPSNEITTTNPILKDLVVSKEVSKHVI